jgi:hypothetical protein
MHPRELTFLMLILASELFVMASFGLIFEKKIFLQLLAVSFVITFLLGMFGVLRMRQEPVFEYRDALAHGYDPLNEAD